MRSFMERDRDARPLLAGQRQGAGRGSERDACSPPTRCIRRAPPRRAISSSSTRPIGEDVAAPALEALAEQGWFADGAIVSVELPGRTDFDPPHGFTLLDTRRYGKARLVFLQYGGP